MNAIAWAYLENIVLVLCATALAYAWDTARPFLLLLCSNTIKTKTKGDA